jgi:preprotein translocase SecE subunit
VDDIEEAEVVEKAETKQKDKTEDKASKKDKKAVREEKEDKEGKKSEKKSRLPRPIAIILTPFFAVGRYFRDSWRELKQVRWPNRKMTWQLTFTVIVYTLIFFVFIAALDVLFEFIFNKVLG